VVTRVGLEGQHAAGQTPVLGLGLQQGQHGLVAAVHAIEGADGERAGRRQSAVMETPENKHAADYESPPLQPSQPRNNKAAWRRLCEQASRADQAAACFLARRLQATPNRPRPARARAPGSDTAVVPLKDSNLK
jgi:hypothetical protein